MSTDLPEGIHPSTVPPIDVLDGLSDEDLHKCIRWWQKENYAVVGLKFWTDELSRRRTEAVLR